MVKFILNSVHHKWPKGLVSRRQFIYNSFRPWMSTFECNSADIIMILLCLFLSMFQRAPQRLYTKWLSTLWFSCSISSQPRRWAFQGFDEGLQQERPAHGEEWRHHSGRYQDDAHQSHLAGKSSSVWRFNFNMSSCFLPESKHCSENLSP